ncbi:hypothetical protein BOX15_Mlig005744g1, partial [Macrostomum lignano]
SKQHNPASECDDEARKSAPSDDESDSDSDSDWDCIQEESMEDFKARQLEKQKNLQQSSSGYTDIGIESFLNSPSPASSSASAASSSRLIDKVNKELERRGGSYLPRGSSVDNGERRGIDELDDDGTVSRRPKKRQAADAAAFDSDDRNVDDEGEAFSEFGQLVYKRMRLLEEESQDRSRDRRLNDSISAKASASAEDKATKQQQQSEQKQQSLAEELKAKRESLVAAIKSDFSTRKSSTASDPGDFTVLAGTRLRLTRLKVSSLDWEQRLMRGRRLVALATNADQLGRQLEQCRSDGVQPVLVAVLVGAVQQQQQKRQSGGSKSSYSIWRLADLARLDQQPAGLFLFGKVHEAHWKQAATGLAVAVLQPRILPARAGSSGSSGMSLAIDNPQQLLILGKAADYGVCGRPTKSGNNGGRCQNAVNLAVCPVCEYHAGQEYRRLASKRSDVASTFVGVEPRKYREPHKPLAAAAASPIGVTFLKSNNNSSIKFGQSHSSSLPTSQASATSGGGGISGIRAFLQQQNASASNSPGARMLRRSIEVSVTTQKQKNQSQQQSQSSSVPFSGISRVGMPDPSSGTNLPFSEFAAGMNRDFRPTLGRGCGVGDTVDLNDTCPSNQAGPVLPKPTVMSVGEIAKLKAIKKMRAAGGMEQLQQQHSQRRLAELNQRLNEDSVGDAAETQASTVSKPARQHRLLGNIDTESPEFLRLMSQSSAYAELASDRVSKEQDSYFNTLERKEQVEAKLATITERKVRVADCAQCGVRCQQPSERCKREGHQLDWTTAVKRPFKCKDCKQTTFTLDCRYPTEPCRRCGGQSYEKTSFATERKGPTLERDVLLARGEERKFVGQ